MEQFTLRRLKQGLARCWVAMHRTLTLCASAGPATLG